MQAHTLGGTALAEPLAPAPAQPLAPAPFREEDFSLDVRVVVTAHPNGKLTCNTNDGCGNTCQGTASACNSYVGDPF